MTYQPNSGKSFFLSFVAVACILTNSFSQNDTPTLNGRVIDSITNNPIKNATVVFFDINKQEIVFSTKTNIKGLFTIVYNKKCDCQLSLIHDNYQTYISTLNYSAVQSITLPLIKLENKRHIHLKEVVVTAKNYTLKRKGGKRIFLPSNELLDLSGSISNLLSYIPAVIVDIDGNVQIRGKEVRIQIDGRSSNLTRAEVLKMLPSDMIQNVEIITSPSASEGSEPKINIITKKNREKGLNGGINSALGFPQVGKAGMHLTMNKEKGFIYSLYGINNNFRTSTESEFLNETENQATVVQREFNNRDRNEISHFSELGYEYNINKNNRLRGGLSFFLESQNFEYAGFRTLSDGRQANLNSKQIRNTSDKEKSFTSEVDYKKEFTLKGHTLRLSLEYGFESNEEEDFFIETNPLENEVNESNTNEKNKEIQVEFRIKHDYPLMEDLKFLVGYQLDYNKLSQNQGFLGASLSNQNNVDFLQRVHSPFVEYEHEIGDFEYEIGLRWELFDRELENILSGSTDKSSFKNLLPNLSMDYEFGKNNELSLSFGKRIRYPRLNWLNSFNTNVNLQNIRIGNPDLEPQQDFEFELEYAKELEKGTLLVSSYASLSRDIVQFVTENQDGLTVTTPQNIGKGDSYGIDIFYGFNSPQWLKTNIKLSAEFGTFPSSQEDTFNDFFNTRASINNFIRLNSYKLELSWIYRSPNRRFQSRTLSAQYFKFGVSRTIFNGKGNIVFSANDPLNTNRRITLINSPNFQYRREFFPNSRQLTLSLFYRFSTKANFRNTEKEKKKKRY